MIVVMNVLGLKCEVAPFYVTPRRPAIHHTMGGLVIDTKAHVLNKDGQIIAGLYSAGENAGGIHAGNRLGGNSLADILELLPILLMRISMLPMLLLALRRNKDRV